MFQDGYDIFDVGCEKVLISSNNFYASYVYQYVFAIFEI